MQHNEGKLKTIDGLNLFTQCWQPDSGEKANIIIVHGYAEHSTRYTLASQYLVRSGYAVYAFDLRGHGRSEGRRAFTSSFDKYLLDLASFLKYVTEHGKGKPIFLLGHSLGGTITASFVITRKPKVNGLILSGPFLTVPRDVSPLLLCVLSVLSKILPLVPVREKVDSRLIARSPEVVDSYDRDPLIYHGKLLAREAYEIHRTLKYIHRNMEEITLPLLIIHGTGDHISNPEGSRELERRTCSRDKTLRFYRGFYHELLNELDNAEVLSDLVRWLDAHI